MTNKTQIILPAILAAGIGFQANAAEISTNTAQMQAMDKITGRVSVINVPVNSEVKFGSFSIVVRDCKTRSPEETPENFAFVDVVDTNTNSDKVNIFKGWMLSSTPALNAIEHPVYDVWLLKCIDTDVSQVKMLTAEELMARDNIPQQLVVQTSAPKVEDNAFSANISGEPIDLLPAAVRQAGEEKMVEDETFALQPIQQEDLQPTEENIQLDNATELDEHAPQSLLNLSTHDEEKPQEIKAHVQIVEDATSDDEAPQIKTDAHILSLPSQEQQTEKQGLPQIPESAIPGHNVESEQQIKTEENGSQSTENLPDNVIFVDGDAPQENTPDATSPTPQPAPVSSVQEAEEKTETEEKTSAPQISDDLLRELDEELKRATEN